VAALVGHSFSCFTKFKGGKGVATAAGGFMVLMPYAMLICVLVWLVTFYASRYVSLASILGAIALPISAFFLQQPQILLGLAVVIAAFVVLRHRTNIVRLANGTENKFAKKPNSVQPPRA
jgi:glycerol-3-phosphate acyltransferase PlsY